MCNRAIEPREAQGGHRATRGAMRPLAALSLDARIQLPWPYSTTMPRCSTNWFNIGSKILVKDLLDSPVILPKFEVV